MPNLQSCIQRVFADKCTCTCTTLPAFTRLVIGHRAHRTPRTAHTAHCTTRCSFRYDGFFFKNDLNVTRLIVAKTVPDLWIVDSELFTYWDTWLETIGLSANAQARRKQGEADAELAYRLVQEFMGQ